MEVKKSVERIVALDVFRGMTIALMFIVNNPGTWSFIYPPLEHAKWQGWTPTDFVYPFFLFTVGVAAWFSLKRYQSERPDASVYWRIFKRGGTIFLIGLGLAMFLNNLSTYQNLRIMGVLQRIGLAYIIGGFICVTFSRTWTAIISLGILAFYWATVKWYSDPQFPFGWHDGANFQGIKGNLVTYIDLKILGATHLYKGFGTAFDPEGLYSTLPAVVSMIFGFFTGNLIDSEKNRIQLVIKMAVLGILGLLVGWFLNEKYFLGDWAFPIAKPIWSPTYVIFMAGWCLVINSVLVWLIDVLNWRRFWVKPFLVLGMNSLLAFVLAGAFAKTLGRMKFESAYETVSVLGVSQPKTINGNQKLYETVFSPLTTPYNLMSQYKKDVATLKNDVKLQPFYPDFVNRQKLASFLFALFHMCLFWAILYVFYRKNIFLKV